MKRLVGLALCTVMMIAAAGGVLVFGDDAANDNNGVVRGVIFFTSTKLGFGGVPP